VKVVICIFIRHNEFINFVFAPHYDDDDDDDDDDEQYA